tara:strand:- start:213 stop:788 length:576 start_codon:yes stop_codon:yes gene_type:complete
MKSDAIEFQPQIITLLIVVLCYFINGPAYPFEGNLIWLPLGAMSLCFLLFGFRVVFAAILASQFSEFWFHSQPFFDQVTLIRTISGAMGPAIAIASMRFFKLSNFFDGDKLVFHHLIFLAILTALFNTLTAFFVSSYIVSNGQANETINATDFLRNYLMGDILGCLIVLFFAALVVVPFIKYFFPKIAPSE